VTAPTPEPAPRTPETPPDTHEIVAAVLVRDGRVLLCHRSPTREWFPDVWDFPGGHVETNEEPTDALRRELLEELSIDIGSVDQEPALHVSDPATGLDLTIWAVTNWHGSVQNVQSNEHDDLDWFTAQELPDLPLAEPIYLDLVRNVLANEGPTPASLA
jgi:mutator protein MutT